MFLLSQEKSAARAEGDENEDDDGKAQEDQELLDSIMESKEQNNGKRIHQVLPMRPGCSMSHKVANYYGGTELRFLICVHQFTSLHAN